MLDTVSKGHSNQHLAKSTKKSIKFHHHFAHGGTSVKDTIMSRTPSTTFCRTRILRQIHLQQSNGYQFYMPRRCDPSRSMRRPALTFWLSFLGEKSVKFNFRPSTREQRASQIFEAVHSRTCISSALHELVDSVDLVCGPPRDPPPFLVYLPRQMRVVAELPIELREPQSREPAWQLSTHFHTGSRCRGPIDGAIMSSDSKFFQRGKGLLPRSSAFTGRLTCDQCRS